MSGGVASAPSAPDESPCIASHEKHGVRVPVMCVCVHVRVSTRLLV